MANEQQHTNLTDTVTTYVTSSLDNLKGFVDRTTDEVAKADVIGANRRIVDHVIEGTKDTITRVAESAARNDLMMAARHLTTGVVENAKETVRVAHEESQRINLVETGAKVAQESLDLMKRQIDLGFDTGSALGRSAGQLNVLKGMSPEAMKRPGTITRVEIESDKGVLRTDAPV